MNQDRGWESFFRIGSDCKQELQFWRNNLRTHNGYAIKPHHPTTQIIFTDASEHSYGGYIFKRLGNIICQGRFTHQEQETSSTNRELLAIKTCLQSFSSQLQHEAVEVRTDNFNATTIIEKGSRKPHLHQIALHIFQICTQNDILLKTTWIPRELNQHADRLSKMTDTNDWSIDQETFNYICQNL